MNFILLIDGKKNIILKTQGVYIRDYDDDDMLNYEIFTLNVISKRFGFIKWLLENKKINMGIRTNVFVESNYFDNIAGLNAYEVLIMYLSIQEEPIKFLISLLK